MLVLCPRPSEAVQNSHCSLRVQNPTWCLFPTIQDISAEEKVFPPQPQACISQANDPIPLLFCFLDLFVELDLARVLFCCFCFFSAPKSQRGFNNLLRTRQP